MASIEKRGDGWRVQIRRKGFPPEYATFPQRAQAVEWAATREAELVGARHGIIPRRTVRQALERYRDEVTPKHRGARWETVRIGKFLGTPLKDGLPRDPSVPFLDRQLLQVAQHDLASWRAASLVHLAPNSVRREYGVLRAVFAVALKEWGWLRQSPFDTVFEQALERNLGELHDELAAGPADFSFEDLVVAGERRGLVALGAPAVEVRFICGQRARDSGKTCGCCSGCHC